MSEKRLEDVLKEVAGDDGNIGAWLRQIIAGFIRQYGGAKKVGEEMARMAMSDDISPASQVSILNNMCRLLQDFSASGDGDGLLSEDQILARLRKLGADFEDEP